ncbi:hypothetical protein K435DRAFT_462467 [Dendrothele bispora CBS 962.96]|uniref:Uncharacterized protein n=1 Tax=Dendrothele bispora (strain CBS 962.96) TaxID=1314807 RepID=A0A4S8ME10_DENBC|nr:hypothetical protein K435DRAFT_462467 [Dendrothele bispora CBS 962.96]
MERGHRGCPQRQTILHLTPTLDSRSYCPSFCPHHKSSSSSSTLYTFVSSSSIPLSSRPSTDRSPRPLTIPEIPRILFSICPSPFPTPFTKPGSRDPRSRLEYLIDQFLQDVSI